VLWALLGILVLFWLIGVVANIAGALIHLVLVVALVVLAYQVLAGRRRI
jgi:hypothetical protein